MHLKEITLKGKAALGVGAVLLACAALVPLTKGRADHQRWHQALAERPPFEIYEHGPVPLAYQVEMQRLENVLARKPKWTHADVDELLAHIHAAPTRSCDPAHTPDEIGREFLADAASSVLFFRLYYDGPMAHGVRDRLVGHLVSNADSNPNLDRRHHCALNLISLGLIEEPEIRAIVERLCAAPDPFIASNMTNQLSWYEHKRSMRTKGDAAMRGVQP